MTDFMGGEVVDKNIKRGTILHTIFHLCGIPTAILEGTKEDWLEIQAQLKNSTDRMMSLGNEISIVRKVVAAFGGEADIDFLQHTPSNERFGSGSKAIAGWIAAFCAFNQDRDFINRFGYRSGDNMNRNFGPYVLEGNP